MYVRFLKPFAAFRAGQIVLAGKGQALGGGVADVLLRRKFAELVPNPTETEPRPARKSKRA